MVQPIKGFCCGFTLTSGVIIILVVNLVLNVVQIATATIDIILQKPTPGAPTDFTMQTFNAAFNLLGLPFIAIAAYGVLYRQEGSLRLYLYYLCFALSLDLFFISSFFFYDDTCAVMPATLKRRHPAYACDLMRVFSFVSVLASFSLEVYCAFVIWSFCHDLATNSSWHSFPELVRQKEAMRSRKRQFGPNYNIGYGCDAYADDFDSFSHFAATSAASLQPPLSPGPPSCSERAPLLEYTASKAVLAGPGAVGAGRDTHCWSAHDP